VYKLRGVGANVIYCEEVAFMDLRIWYQVIVPLMEVIGTVIIAITTPQGMLNARVRGAYNSRAPVFSYSKRSPQFLQ
jgi:hypothetical protein